MAACPAPRRLSPSESGSVQAGKKPGLLQSPRSVGIHREMSPRPWKGEIQPLASRFAGAFGNRMEFGETLRRLGEKKKSKKKNKSKRQTRFSCGSGQKGASPSEGSSPGWGGEKKSLTQPGQPRCRGGGCGSGGDELGSHALSPPSLRAFTACCLPSVPRQQEAENLGTGFPILFFFSSPFFPSPSPPLFFFFLN